ncbi:hypothetical protein [Deinococcus ruber]|uniref:Uncharacterized protein n=1 Tax=Deinococcus ruber TaxID=1848197 RepID=A0A918FIX1_9DEIO|nr:hypothetical protein [Deinococcus ruber]GGR40500.1 hypothetical protein GCM10008957_56190 [Deinococcus ruber]
MQRSAVIASFALSLTAALGACGQSPTASVTPGTPDLLQSAQEIAQLTHATPGTQLYLLDVVTH